MPTTPREKYRLEAVFGALAQGTLSTRSYIQLLRDKSNELRVLGIPIAKERIVCMLLATLKDPVLKLLIHNLHPSTSADECLNSILRYDKDTTPDILNNNIDITTPSVLMVEQQDNATRSQYSPRCFICHQTGHTSFDCPLKQGDKSGPSETLSHYKPSPTYTNSQRGQSPSPTYHNYPAHQEISYPNNQMSSAHHHHLNNDSPRNTSPYDLNYRGTHPNTSHQTSPSPDDSPGDYQAGHRPNQYPSPYRSNNYHSSGPPNEESRVSPWRQASYHKSSSYDNNRSNYDSREPRSMDRSYDSNQSSYYQPHHHQQSHGHRTPSSDSRGYSGPRRDPRDRSRDRYAHRNLRSRERSSSHHTRPQLPDSDSVQPMSQTQFRTLLTECLSAAQSKAPEPPTLKQLSIEGEPNQHICDQVTLLTNPTTESTPNHYRTFMMTVIDASDNSSDEAVPPIASTLLEVVDLTLEDLSTILSPKPILSPTLSTDNQSPNEGVWTPQQSQGPDPVWTVAQLLQWARSQQITVTGWESEGLSPETIARMLEPENCYIEESPP